MLEGVTVSLCLPCRNEGNHLKEVVKRIPSFVDEVIIVSNKSTDNTVEVAEKIGGKVKVIEDNRAIGGIGYGFAHISGIEKASGEIIVTADGDATYPIQDSRKIVKYLIDHKLDFISCNRYPLQSGTVIPLKLRVGVGLLNLEIRMLYGIKIKDALSGMWVFRKSIVGELRLDAGDWNLSPQIKVNAATNPNIRFEEYSIAQHQRLGETKQNYFKTGFNHAVWIFFNRFKKKK